VNERRFSCHNYCRALGNQIEARYDAMWGLQTSYTQAYITCNQSACYAHRSDGPVRHRAVRCHWPFASWQRGDRLRAAQQRALPSDAVRACLSLWALCHHLHNATQAFRQNALPVLCKRSGAYVTVSWRIQTCVKMLDYTRIQLLRASRRCAHSNTEVPFTSRSGNACTKTSVLTTSAGSTTRTRALTQRLTMMHAAKAGISRN
jgi:hypothetical protein